MEWTEENGCLYVGSHQYNTLSLMGVTGDETECTLHYPDFDIEIDAPEAAAVWDWWTRRD